MRRRRREKVFGPGRAVPLDRNAKARIAAYSRAWDRLHRQPGQRGGALGRAALDVLGALLWVFHNARSGVCFPSYETIAGKAGCARSTVAEAIKALEFAGVLTWQNRIVRIRERCRDLFGRVGWRWRVVRTSNAYVLIDPASKSDQRTGNTRSREFKIPLQAPAVDPDSPLRACPCPPLPRRSQQRMALNKAPGRLKRPTTSLSHAKIEAPAEAGQESRGPSRQRQAGEAAPGMARRTQRRAGGARHGRTAAVRLG